MSFLKGLISGHRCYSINLMLTGGHPRFMQQATLVPSCLWEHTFIGKYKGEN